MSIRMFGAAVLTIFAMSQFSTAPTADAGNSSDDLVKAVAGLAVIAIIANEVKKGKQARKSNLEAAQAAAEEQAKKNRGPRICQSPSWDGQVWRDADGTKCLPTPVVCKRETRRSGRNIVIFDSDCMWREGFRLSRKY